MKIIPFYETIEEFIRKVIHIDTGREMHVT